MLLNRGVTVTPVLLNNATAHGDAQVVDLL
jgi:hypothetical protein